MTNEEYRERAEKHAPRSRVGRNCLGAFLVGGTICCLGQLLNTAFLALGLDEQAAGTAESVALVALGALLTALGVYDDLAKVGRAQDRRTGHRHGGQDVFHRRAGDRLRPRGQRRLRPDPVPAVKRQQRQGRKGCT